MKCEENKQQTKEDFCPWTRMRSSCTYYFCYRQDHPTPHDDFTLCKSQLHRVLLSWPSCHGCMTFSWLLCTCSNSNGLYRLSLELHSAAHYDEVQLCFAAVQTPATSTPRSGAEVLDLIAWQNVRFGHKFSHNQFKRSLRNNLMGKTNQQRHSK